MNIKKDKDPKTTKNTNKKYDIQNNLFLTKLNYSEKKEKPEDIIFNKNILLKKYIDKKKEDKEIKQNFIDFIIDEQPHYADLKNITNHYKNAEKKMRDQYNNNLLIIQKKKELLNSLNSQINKVLLDNLKITDRDAELFYENEIASKKREIKLKQHELEIYHQLFNMTYKINYKITNKLELETKYAKMYNEQYEKYSIVKNTSLTTLQKQQEMLKYLNLCYEQFTTNNENAINEKSKQLNKAEYEVYMIKNDIISLEKGIEKLKKRKKELKEQIIISQNNYEQKYFDYILAKKNYIKDFIKMEDIYQVLKVDNVSEILKKYNRLNQEYNNKSLLLKIKSIEIVNLNSTLKSNNDIIKDIYNQIEKFKTEINSKNKLKNDEEEKIILQKRQIKYYISSIYDTLKEKINTFTLCVNNALRYIYKIIESMDNASIKGPFSYKKRFTRRFNHFLNEDLKSINVDFEKEYNEKKMLLFVIVLIKSLNYFLFKISINISYSIYNKIIEEDEIKKISKIDNDSPSTLYISSSNILTKRKEEPKIVKKKNKVEIYGLANLSIQKFFEKELKYSITKLNEKKKIYSRSAKDILKQKITKKNDNDNCDNDNIIFFNKEDINSVNETLNISFKSSTINSNTNSSKNKKNKNKKLNISQNKIISKEDFIKLYYLYYQKSLNDNKFQDIKMPNIKLNSFYSNRFTFIDDFINDHVSNKILKEKLDKEKKERIHKKSQSIKAKIEEKELMDFINKRKKEEKKIKNINTDDDEDLSYEKQKEEKEEQRLILIHKELEEWKKKKKYKLKSKEPEMNTILERLDDLRGLELHYSKNNQNFLLDSIFFNEYYFKLKKQLNNAQKSARSLNRTGQGFYKKVNTPIKNSFRHIDRNNSVLLDKHKIKKIQEGYNTSRFMNITKNRFNNKSRKTIFTKNIRRDLLNMNKDLININNSDVNLKKIV